jgi:hypothetical protein
MLSFLDYRYGILNLKNCIADIEIPDALRIEGVEELTRVGKRMLIQSANEGFLRTQARRGRYWMKM